MHQAANLRLVTRLHCLQTVKERWGCAYTLLPRVMTIGSLYEVK